MSPTHDKKTLTTSDYVKIANSAESLNIIKLANSLPKKINEILSVCDSIKTQNDNPFVERMIESFQLALQTLSKAATQGQRQNLFSASFRHLSEDIRYQAYCNSVATIVYQLEKALLDTFEAWYQPEPLLHRRKPEHSLEDNVALHEDDYKVLFMLIHTLKTIYDQYPDTTKILFPHKDKILSLIHSIEPERKPQTVLQKS